MAKAARETWSKRVERWKDSGLTAREFGQETGINPRTLVYWKWRLNRGSESADPKARKESRALKSKKRSTTPAPSPLSFVEVSAAERARDDGRFELELPSGERVRMSTDFDAEGLGRLLEVLEGRR